MYTNEMVYIPKLNEKVHATRIIASWRNRNGNMYGFKSWLKELGLDDYDITRVWYLATNGKLELQDLADEWLDAHKEYRD